VTLRTSAESIARRTGWRLFPCREEGKEPACEHGCRDASSDTKRFRYWQDNENIGLACGLGSGVWVLDLDDAPEGGISGAEALARVMRDLGVELPDTLTAQTPRGGCHYFWTYPRTWLDERRITVRARLRLEVEGELFTGRSAPGSAGILTGLDTRGEGGYVLIAPSRVLVTKGPYSGQVRPYRWMTTGIAPQPAPEWLIRLVLPPLLPPPAPSADYAGRDHPYALAVLESACQAVATCGNGEHHDTWLRQGRLVGGYVGGGHLDRANALSRLVTSAESGVKGRRREIRRTLEAGMEYGIGQPCHPPERT